MPASAAVINADTAFSAEVTARCKARGLKIFSVGKLGTELNCSSTQREGLGQHLKLQSKQKIHSVYLPLVGDFRPRMRLWRQGLCLPRRRECLSCMRSKSLQGAKGRLELVGKSEQASIFVDYAHTPDALDAMIAVCG